MSEQIDMLYLLDKEDAKDLKKQAEIFKAYISKKRKWEDAFQKWSDRHGIDADNTKSWGCCGYGSMCDWCEDNTYGRPCVRALNAMCRERMISINYDSYDFEYVWRSGAE